MTGKLPGWREGSNTTTTSEEVSLCKGGKVMKECSVFGKYSDAELVDKLKGLAVDPSNSEYSLSKIRAFWNQIIGVRKAMGLSDTEFPRRKRKLQQLLKALPGYGPELSNLQSGTKLSRGQVSHVSSASCFLSSLESAESFDQKILLESHSSNSLLTCEDDFLEKRIYSKSPFVCEPINCSSPCKDVFPLVDSDESVNCSNPASPENLTSQEVVPSLNMDDIGRYSNSAVLDTPNQNHRQPPWQFDNIKITIVPVGARFQADVPDWTGPCNDGGYDSESSRWLGTRVWPIERRGTKITTRVVGKGRPESCSCLSRGSMECVRRHILEERLLLLCDVGPAFFSWKLDEMGEAVSKSWTLEEQNNFESFARTKVLSNGKDLLKHALKCFPSKSRKEIISYYLNVFIPRRMSLQTRSSFSQVDTDEDEVENSNYLGFRQKSNGKTPISSSKVVKARFLRQSS
ncbi:hypothetical protein ACH5RR_004950 [Cinchona calisaya]|uniref:ELM2 domain-containing protein n=1 Tax=Cinchona calisaya TaxID=153742 RepID=A0ABD3AZ19_9GENT